MNTTRFLNFGKYDFTINKSFYRNITLTTIFGSVGLAITGFFGRLMEFKGAETMGPDYSVLDVEQRYEAIREVTDPASTPFTSAMIFTFCLCMMFIFAGYTFHNLRNKQGRITELTIPATNLERWTWHVLVALVGGFIVCCISVLTADAVNAIANLCAYGTHIKSSLTADVAQIAALGIDESTNFLGTGSAGIIFLNPSFAWAMRIAAYCCVLAKFSAYVFGNSIKYKYNIILTYIVLQVVNMIVGICLLALIGYLDEKDVDLYAEGGTDTIIYFFWTVSAIAIALCSLLFVGSYRNYCKAQITSSLNK